MKLYCIKKIKQLIENNVDKNGKWLEFLQIKVINPTWEKNTNHTYENNEPNIETKRTNVTGTM